MMIIMRATASQKEIDAIVERVKQNGLRAHVSTGEERTVIGAIGDGRPVFKDQFMHLPGVDRVMPISRPYKLASREFRPENSIFPLDGVGVGGQEIVIIAGPCSVESRQQMLETAQAVREAGAHALRGGAFKPRTSPYSGGGARNHRYAGNQRSDARRTAPNHDSLRGCATGWSAQYAKLPFIARHRREPASGDDQARHDGHYRRVAYVR